VWRELGPHEFEAQYEFFMAAPPSNFEDLKNGGGWLPAGRGVLTERIKLSDDAQTFTSTIRYDALDSMGKPLEESGEAEVRGERIGY
jgi:hypothetical protein